MNNPNDVSNSVSPTLADTLSESERQNLRGATQDHPNMSATYAQSPGQGGAKTTNQWQQPSFSQRIQEHPVMAIGLAVLGGLFVRSLFSHKD